jgi:hypothetical protein
MALNKIPITIHMTGGGGRRLMTRRRNRTNKNANRKKPVNIKKIATRRRIVYIGNKTDRAKTQKKDKMLSLELAKIPFQKKRNFLTKKGLLKCGSKTPGKTVDILMGTVGFKE